MYEAKIRLSKKEMELITDAGLILTKNEILQKVKRLLELLAEEEQPLLQSASLPHKVTATSPKISRGENYKGLPWLVLDYPRLFSPSAVFAIRTMFWWGNFFSITVHLSGDYKEAAEQKIITSYPFFKDNTFFYCVHEEQWEHHFEESNYIPLTEINKDDFEKRVKEKSFIKLAKKIPLSEWEEAPDLLLMLFKKIVQLLETNEH